MAPYEGNSTVNSFKKIQVQESDTFCLGFFGDPMQKIYMTGIGEIPAEEGWETLRKPENFRCPQKVLATINAIRSHGDRLEQTRGRQDNDGNPIVGSSNTFVLPMDDQKQENISLVRQYLARTNEDENWSSENPKDIKILVIVHRMAAKELGFEDLYAAFKNKTPESLKASFDEGNSWVLRPFLKFILPLISAHKEGQHQEEINLIRVHSHMLNSDNLRQNPKQVMNKIKEILNTLDRDLADGSTKTIKDILQYLKIEEFLELDERFNFNSQEVTFSEDEEENTKYSEAIQRIYANSATQLWGYLKYLNEESPYSTQQGVKGAEFERVMVILDDEAGSSYNSFSYDKLFGLKEGSDTDKKNLQEGKDSVYDRTRRLFYVCCSRAEKDLAVVFFSSNVSTAAEAFRESGLFEPENVLTLEDIAE